MIDDTLLELYRMAEGLELLIEEYLLEIPIISQGHTGTDITNTIIPEYIPDNTDII